MSEIAGIDPTSAPSGTGCADCDAMDSWWFHLRRCAQCGHVGCCDDSLNGHATVHATQSGHPIIQSFEPGEDWFWNFETEEMVAGPALAPPPEHPVDQTTPGPRERVPDDWQAVLLNRRSG